MDTEARYNQIKYCIHTQSLKTTLSISLNSKFPMFLFFGVEHICFCNDAYRPSLGMNGKHPAAGKSVAAIWPEIWLSIKLLIDLALCGGKETWNEDLLLPIYRNGNGGRLLLHWKNSGRQPVPQFLFKLFGIIKSCDPIFFHWQQRDYPKTVKL